MAHWLDPFSTFQNDMEKHRVFGLDGTGDNRKVAYVPYPALAKYWTAERVNNALNSREGDSLSVSVETIRERFVRIFSILAYSTSSDARRIDLISQFIRNNIDDYQLPLSKSQRPKVFSEGAEGQASWEAFYKHQFRFSPRSLGPTGFPHDSALEDGCIIPWQRGVELSRAKNESTIVETYKVNPDSDLYKEVKVIAVKRIKLDHRLDKLSKEATETFSNELKAYMALRNNAPKNAAAKYFLRYYGSFRQGGWGYVLLEHADEGSLADFFLRSKNMPYYPWQVYNLWEGMWNLLGGLEILHNFHNDRRSSSAGLSGVHQDLKPSNIFVFRVPNGKADSKNSHQQKYIFKIGDFGLSSMRINQDLHPDNKGTTMYGAPELMTVRRDLRGLDGGAKPSVDIWSLGCIFLETLIWIICGEGGRAEFLSMRVKEGDSNGAFHNNGGDLDALDQMFKKALSCKRQQDDLTEPIQERVMLSMMCSTPEDRLDARALSREFRNILEKAKSRIDFPSDQDSRFTIGSLLEQQDRHRRGTVPARPTLESPASYMFNATISGSPDQEVSGLISAELPSQEVECLPTPIESISGQSPGHLNQMTECSGSLSSPHRRPPLASESTRVNTIVATPSQRINGRTTSLFCDPLTSAAPISPITSPDPQQEPSAYLATPTNPASTQQISPTTENQAIPRNQTPPSLPDVPGDNPQPPLAEQTPSRVTVERASRYISNRASRDLKFPAHPDIGDILKYKRAKKDKRVRKDFKLQGQDDAVKYQTGREQFFIIDDSKTMYQHRHDVLDTFEALSHLVKSCDPDGIELFLISKPDSPEKAKKAVTDTLVEFLEKSLKTEPTGQNDNIETNFGIILDKVNGMKPDSSWRPRVSRSSFTRSRKRDISVYCFTDAMWDDDDKNGCLSIANPLRNLIRQMHKNDKQRNSIMIQFIQFGNDPEGTKRLRYLDNKLKSEKGMKNIDIIDRKPFDSNVWDILIGSLNCKVDGGNSDDEGATDQRHDTPRASQSSAIDQGTASS